MASIFERIALVFRSKANKALDKYEDPRETLDYSYQKQLELLLCYMTGLETCTQRFFPIGQEYGTNSPSTHSLPISPGISGIPITLKTGREQMDSWT